MGAVYHVTSRGDAKSPIFKDAEARGMSLNMLEQVSDRYHWFCHAYCLLTNHYPLVIETPDANLSKGIRHLNGVYTTRFNRRHGSVGTFPKEVKKLFLFRKRIISTWVVGSLVLHLFGRGRSS